MSKSQQQISFNLYNGYYYTEILWDRISQFLGIGKYYEPWKIGKIYVRSDLKFGPSMKICGNSFFYEKTTQFMKVRQNFNINTFYRLKKKTCKMLVFAPILCVHEKDVKNGMKLLGIHRNYRFAEDNDNRNPIGRKIILKNRPQIPEGYGLYEERNYYYMRIRNETDRQFKSRKENNFFRKKKPKSGNNVKLESITFGDVLKLK
jgi:hypothetical protein